MLGLEFARFLAAPVALADTIPATAAQPPAFHVVLAAPHTARAATDVQEGSTPPATAVGHALVDSTLDRAQACVGSVTPVRSPARAPPGALPAPQGSTKQRVGAAAASAVPLGRHLEAVQHHVIGWGALLVDIDLAGVVWPAQREHTRVTMGLVAALAVPPAASPMREPVAVQHIVPTVVLVKR